MDDLEEILELREEFEEKGLTFYIHVDAAWGGYFATVLRSKDGQQLNAVEDSHYVHSVGEIHVQYTITVFFTCTLPYRKSRSIEI